MSIAIQYSHSQANDIRKEVNTMKHTPAKLAKEYDVRTCTNRDKWQRSRLNGVGSLCNSISWNFYHGIYDKPH